MLRLMTMPPSRLLLAGVLTAACAACGGTQAVETIASQSEASKPATPAGDTSRAAFDPLTFEVPAGTERAYKSALAGGALGGDEQSGCLWLEHGNGQTTALRLMTDDEALRVDFAAEPFVLRSGDDVVAVEGQQVEVSGGAGLTTYAPPCPVSTPTFAGILVVP